MNRRDFLTLVAVPLLPQVPVDAPTLRWSPEHRDLVYTFGGAAPKHRIRSGTRIITWTEDCFDGVVKTANDLPSKVMPPGHDNPQTGPFFVEGAEPGDTIAIHILSLTPAREYAVSSFAPGFGALVGTDRTAMVGAELPETTWRTTSTLRGRRRAARRVTAVTRGPCRSRPFSAAWGSRRPAVKCAARSCPGRSAATWTAPRSAPAIPCFAVSTCPADSCRSAMDITRWATGRSWVPPSRAP